MDRRDFLKGGLALGAGALAAGSALPAFARAAMQRGFRLKYAPHLGMFEPLAGSDPIDQLQFMADQGFTAFEDNDMAARPVELQEAMARTMRDLGLTMGAFVATRAFGDTTFVSSDGGSAEKVLADVRQATEVAERVGAAWCTVALGGCHRELEQAHQAGSAAELLKRCAGICEPSGLVMVLEPLSFEGRLGTVMSGVSHAYTLCRAVGSPSCRALFDIHHQQVTEGNIIASIDRAWDEIAYFRIGDGPGRNEPTTGEINYRNVFRHIHARGYAGLLGMDHGSSRPGADGARAVLDAYVTCDSF